MLNNPAERDKFEQLYHEYERLMLYVARSILNDHFLAEDAVNDAFIKIINNYEKLFASNDKIICPRTKRLVVIITKNTALDILKKRNHNREDALETEEGVSILDGISFEKSTQDLFFHEYDLKKIKKAFSTLPEQQKLTLYYFAILGESIKNIANIMGEKPETVKKRLQRARKTLKEVLDNYDK